MQATPAAMGASSYSSLQLQFTNGWMRQFYFRAQSSDEHVIKQVLGDSKYGLERLARSPELAGFIQTRSVAGKRPLVIDAGANIGASSIFFTAKFANAFVVAIEPDRGNCELLQKNILGTGIVPLRAAVSSTPGHARVVDPGKGHWGYRTENTTDTSASDVVERVTINDLYRRHCTGCFPFLVKIDIEGGEADLFSDNTEWVARTPLLIIELHDWLLLKSGNSRSFLRCISQLDRDFVHIGEDIYSIANNLDFHAPP